MLQVAAEDLEEADTPSPPKKVGDVNGGGGGSPPAGEQPEQQHESQQAGSHDELRGSSDDPLSWRKEPATPATKHRTGCNGSVGGQDMLHELLFEVRAMQALFRQLQTQPLPAWFFSVNVDGTHSVCWQGLCSSTTQSTLQQWSTMLKVSEVRIDILDILKLTVLEAHYLRDSAM